MRTIDALADLLLGASCPGCGRARWGTCPSCRREVSSPQLQLSPEGLHVVGLCAYEGVGGAMVRALKDGGAWSVAKVCGPGLGRALDLVAPAGVALVPAPSLPASVRRRGFDHSAALARAAVRPGDRVVAALHRSRRVADQAGLDHEDRLVNQHASMLADPPGSGPATAVVVDDICTTAATVLEARRALRRAGWQVAGAVVVAITEKRIPVRGSTRGLGAK
ncbi:ComF family protein [Propionibacteriaceae bacterium Y1923]